MPHDEVGVEVSVRLEIGKVRIVGSPSTLETAQRLQSRSEVVAHLLEQTFGVIEIVEPIHEEQLSEVGNSEVADLRITREPAQECLASRPSARVQAPLRPFGRGCLALRNSPWASRDLRVR